MSLFIASLLSKLHVAVFFSRQLLPQKVLNGAATEVLNGAGLNGTQRELNAHK